MDREKINKQAQVLRSKKLAKSVQPIAPKVQNGVVKVEIPIPKNRIKTYSTPKPPTHLAKQVTNSEQKVQRQIINPQNVSTTHRPVRKKNCVGCRRKIRNG